MWSVYEGGITPQVKEVINAYLKTLGWGQTFDPECVFWGLPEEDTLVVKYHLGHQFLGIYSVGREEEVFTSFMADPHQPSKFSSQGEFSYRPRYEVEQFWDTLMHEAPMNRDH